MEADYLIVGLGNPGPEYRFTRHNFGFRLLDRLLAVCEAGAGVCYWPELQAEGAAVSIAGRKLFLLKPLTYMNRSGSSLAAIRTGGLLSAGTNLLVVHDDLDLPLGRIKLKAGGGSGGHRGIESIIAALGTSDFLRLRLGIGSNERGSDTVAFVLSSFTPEEETVVEKVLERALAGIRIWLAKGYHAAMCELNRALPGMLESKKNPPVSR